MFSNLEQGFILALLAVIAYSLFRMSFDLQQLQRTEYRKYLAVDRMATAMMDIASSLNDISKQRDVV